MSKGLELQMAEAEARVRHEGMAARRAKAHVCELPPQVFQGSSPVANRNGAFDAEPSAHALPEHARYYEGACAALLVTAVMVLRSKDLSLSHESIVIGRPPSYVRQS